METQLTNTKRNIPSFDNERREVDVSGMGLTAQMALSFDDFRTAIKRELAALVILVIAFLLLGPVWLIGRLWR